jgi:hypothetical protein
MIRSGTVLHMVYAMVLAMALAMATAGMAADQPDKVVGKHKEIHAVVETVVGGVAHLKEPGQLQLRMLSPMQLERMQLKDLTVGDEVSLIVDENNVIIDAHKAGVAGRGHQTLKGAFVAAENSGKTITVKTPAGLLKTFKVDSAAASKVPALKKGALVKVELDEAGTVIDIHADK